MYVRACTCSGNKEAVGDNTGEAADIDDDDDDDDEDVDWEQDNDTEDDDTAHWETTTIRERALDFSPLPPWYIIRKDQLH